jgi:N-acyl amino acid synthase of PEP-CTERM/exosortase system
MPEKNIIEAFDEYFEMVPAISEELKNEVYKLRYQVYCVETGFENSECYPDALEYDDYDLHSVHYLIRHRKSGDYAATTRLILPDANNPEKLFQLELNCRIDNTAILQTVNRKHLAEVSRFCVSKAFKRRKNEAHTLAGINSSNLDYFTPNERRIFPHLTLALMACIIKASYENDIHYLYVTTELSWVRFVASLGIYLIKIGPVADYHGERYPWVIKVTDLLDSVSEKNVEAWNMLTDNGRFWKT